MKKLFSFALVAFAALSMNAAQLDLGLEELTDEGWGGCTYSAATHTLTFPSAWECGRGWWLEADLSAYDRVVVEFESAPAQIGLNVNYMTADAEGHNYVQQLVGAGSKSAEIVLDPARKNNVEKVYLQASAPCSLVLKAAYAISGQAVDPIAGLTGVEVGEMTEPGKTCYLPLAVIREYAYFEILVSNKTDEAQNGWGVGKIVAVSNWDTPAFELGCNNPGTGNVNRYVIEQADMLEYAKLNGAFHTDEYGQQGVHINVYDDKATLVSVKGYGEGGSSDERQRTDLGVANEYGCVELLLETINAYDEFEIVVNITNAEVGANWGIGKIVPINLWDGPFFEYKSVKAGAGEQTIVVAKADMLEYAKVNGVYHTDDYSRQGVTINAYDDKCALVKVVGVGAGAPQPQGVEDVQREQSVRKVLRNGVLYIERGGNSYTVTGHML
ncbi:MAG: hypothetical protein IJ581_00545 [Paludibacteraceae bacterium]|nr:hypothetical protein [Paludibacteraceae bacterium]